MVLLYHVWGEVAGIPETVWISKHATISATIPELITIAWV
jgi:hypothetical protein